MNLITEFSYYVMILALNFVFFPLMMKKKEHWGLLYVLIL